ncbi:MAG TPA: hypothetical protein VFR07_06375, partial [Mycobacteriales bacterium]|nr:hypothetical protein [Mycobacteriales bacterium]
MFTSPDDLPAHGWILPGDPGPFPPVDTEPGCYAENCPGGDGPAAAAGLAADGLAADGLAADRLAADGLAADSLAGWAAPGVPRPAAGPHPLLAALTGALDAI